MSMVLLPTSIHVENNFDSQNGDANDYELPFSALEEDEGDEQLEQNLSDPFEWWTEINYKRYV